MEITRNGSQPSVKGPEDWFTGTVRIDKLFDRTEHRLDLLKALGYQQKPLTYQEERAIWFKVSSQIEYPDRRLDPLRYDDPPTRVLPYPTDINLSVRRALLDQQPNLRIPVRIRLKNPDPARLISALTIIDELPDGYAYVPDSVTVTSGGVAVVRIAPLELFLGPIVQGGRLTILYSIKPAAAQGR